MEDFRVMYTGRVSNFYSYVVLEFLINSNESRLVGYDFLSRETICLIAFPRKIAAYLSLVFYVGCDVFFVIWI